MDSHLIHYSHTVTELSSERQENARQPSRIPALERGFHHFKLFSTDTGIEIESGKLILFLLFASGHSEINMYDDLIVWVYRGIRSSEGGKLQPPKSVPLSCSEWTV